MKTLLVIALSVLAYSFSSFNTAFAQGTVKVVQFTELHLVGDELVVAYDVAGGCATHEAEFYVELVKSAKFWLAKIHVLDSADKVDSCEAIVKVSGRVHLSDLIVQAASRMQLSEQDINRITIQLPTTLLTLTTE